MKELPRSYAVQIRAGLIFCHVMLNQTSVDIETLFSYDGMIKILEKSGFWFTKILAVYEYFINDNKDKALKLIEKAKIEAARHFNIGERIMELESINRLELIMR